HTRFSRDWSSDVCSSDLHRKNQGTTNQTFKIAGAGAALAALARAAKQAAELLLKFFQCLVQIGWAVVFTTAASTPRVLPLVSRRSEERRVGKAWSSKGWP